jgi:hypothetical protein
MPNCAIEWSKAIVERRKTVKKRRLFPGSHLTCNNAAVGYVVSGNLLAAVWQHKQKLPVLARLGAC